LDFGISSAEEESAGAQIKVELFKKGMKFSSRDIEDGGRCSGQVVETVSTMMLHAKFFLAETSLYCSKKVLLLSQFCARTCYRIAKGWCSNMIKIRKRYYGLVSTWYEWPLVHVGLV
jgi:hypothetical protein